MFFKTHRTIFIIKLFWLELYYIIFIYVVLYYLIILKIESPCPMCFDCSNMPELDPDHSFEERVARWKFYLLDTNRNQVRHLYLRGILIRAGLLGW